MNSISSIEQLIQSFQEAEPAERGFVLENIAIPRSEFSDLASWADGCYTRNCLARCDDFEFILICWDGHCKTKIHDHSGQDCWVYQVEGTLHEIRFKGPEHRLDAYHEEQLNPGDLGYMHDKMGYHLIENRNKQRAMSLHIYANPIDECKVFDEESSRFEITPLVYDEVHDVVTVG
ncbi:MAG: hypothetical protein Salg2KO_05430 [Salibacteraceae bacterium]